METQECLKGKAINGGRPAWIDTDVDEAVSLFFSLKEIERKFNDGLKELQNGNPEEGFGGIADKFYLGYVNMQSAFKSLLAERVSLKIEKSI